MTRIVSAMIVGFIISLIAMGVITCYFVISRPYRWRRNSIALGLGYLLVPSAALACLGLISRALDRLGIFDHSDWLISGSACSLVWLAGVILIGASEMKWRRKQEIGDKVNEDSLNKSNPRGWETFAAVAVPLLLIFFALLKRNGRPTFYILFVEFILLTPAMWLWERRRNRLDGKNSPETNRKLINQKILIGITLLSIGTILGIMPIPTNTAFGALLIMIGVIVIFKYS
jgi:hypothetical protein